MKLTSAIGIVNLCTWNTGEFRNSVAAGEFALTAYLQSRYNTLGEEDSNDSELLVAAKTLVT